MRHILIFLLLVTTSCDLLLDKQAAQKKKKVKDGLVVSKKDGKVYAKINYKKGKKQGWSENYYDNGNLRAKIFYRNDLKDSLAIMYYENGKKYRETMYKKDKKHGWQRKYREDGKIMAEIPYYEDDVCAGLKEYYLSGKIKPVSDYPGINVQYKNNLMKDGTYRVKIYFDKRPSVAKYYIGELDEHGRITFMNTEILPKNANNEAYIDFRLPSNTYIMQKLHIIGATKTIQGNEYIATKVHNLALENKL